MNKLPIYNWEVLNNDPNVSIIDILLNNRNLSDGHLEKFRLSDRLHDPYLLKDMDKAVERVIKAIEQKEKITIYGDYDVDGVVSTAMMLKFFEKIGVQVNFLLPNRQVDGYGLKENGVAKSVELNTNLLITVDNGITSYHAVEAARNNGIDVVIFDHHLQEADLPPANAVVNPNRKDCTYPFKGLCGAGVVYKFFHAIGKELFSETEFKNFMMTHLDLLVIATIADVVPLIDENYAIAKFGLKSLNQTLRTGIVELKRVSGLLDKEITPISVGFYLAPRLNVAGRLEDADLAVHLLLANNLQQAEKLAKKLNKLNGQRQQMQEDYIRQANEIVKNSNLTIHRALIIVGEEWDSGLIGIVSGRLKDQYNRPVITFTRDQDGNYVGSARSVDRFHITEALTKFNDLYITYGGHHKAAGLTLSEQNLAIFVEKFTRYADSKINLKDLRQSLIIDTLIHPEQVNESLVKTIRGIGPFGEGNPEPVLLLKNANLKELFSLSMGRHLKMIFESGSREFECVWWRRGEYKDVLSFYMAYDIAFKPSLNLWNGRESLQLVIEDIKETMDL